MRGYTTKQAQRRTGTRRKEGNERTTRKKWVLTPAYISYTKVQLPHQQVPPIHSVSLTVSLRTRKTSGGAVQSSVCLSGIAHHATSPLNLWVGLGCKTELWSRAIDRVQQESRPAMLGEAGQTPRTASVCDS